MTKRRLFTCFVMIVAASSLQGERRADTSDNKGTDFFLAFPQTAPGPTPILTLFLAAQNATTVEISGPEVATTTFDIPAASVLEVCFSPDPTRCVPDGRPQVSIVNRVGSEGIRVRSLDPLDLTQEGTPIAVYAMSRRPGSAGAYMALPVNVLDTEYRAVSRPGIGMALGSQVTIVGTEQNTTVGIETLVNVPNIGAPGNLITAGVPTTIVLNRLQTFLLQLQVGDLTGTLVTADKPVAVFSGNQNGTVLGGFSQADYIVEQIVPVSAWWDEFVIAPIAPRTAGDVIRVLAHEDETEIEINGELTTTLNAGQFHEFIQPSSSGTWLKTSKPSLVTQYNKGQRQGDTVSTDPFAMLVPPVKQFSRQYLFKTPGTPYVPFPFGSGSNWLNIVVEAGDEAGLLLNNAALPASTTWTSVDGYKYARLTIPAGTHHLEHQEPNVRFGAWVYGHALTEGYGYVAGHLFNSHPRANRRKQRDD